MFEFRSTNHLDRLIRCVAYKIQNAVSVPGAPNKGGLTVGVKELVSIDSSLNPLINDRQVELITHGSPSIIYLFCVILRAVVQECKFTLD